MSKVQWLGIWAMTEFSKPDDLDLNSWSTSVIHVLEDPKGLHYFEEYLSKPERDSRNKAEVLSAWVKFHEFELKGTRITKDDIQQIKEILDGVRGHLSTVPGEINSWSETSIKEVVKIVKEAAKCYLIEEHSSFIAYLNSEKQNRRKSWKCQIL